ncbi:MAG: hypothetical protein EHM43_03965 [Ignavibacteriae bacterium]|nr:MAG: hypothetical protein EHM43_03965 [Ignavibacteriota bacterium]
MHKLWLTAVAVVLMVVATACSTVESPVNVGSEDGRSAGIASTTIEHTEGTYSYIGINPCTNEEISGDINYTFNYMIREQGNGKRVVRYKFEDRGVLYGTTSGDKYQWIGGLDLWEEVEIGGCPWTVELRDERMLPVKGGKNNWILKYLLKFTFTCDGYLNVDVETLDSYCQ